MTEAKLNIPKTKMQDPEDWDLSLAYFLNDFSLDAQFFNRSQKVHIPLIQDLFGQYCSGMFRKSPVAMVDLKVFRLREFGLIHGSCFADGKYILLIYQTDIHKGVFGIFKYFNQSLIHSTRVTALPPKELEKEVLYGDRFDGRVN